MSRTYRVAIVGTGAIAAVHAAALQHAVDRAAIVAVVDVDLGRARAFAAEWGIGRVYASTTELLDKESVDVVHLCAPPRQHAPITLECLAAGVTVFVEKPPTLSLAEMDELAEAEQASAGFVATVFQHRFGPAAMRLRQMAAAGELGRALLASCATLWYRDDAYFDVPWRGTWDSEGGGPTMGHGIHQFDLLLSILGPWQEIRALATRRARDVQTEDVSMALVTFSNGAVATVVNSVVSPRETSALRFDYEHATIEVEHLYGYTDADWSVHPVTGHEDISSRWQKEPSDLVSGHGCQIEALYDALDRDGTPPVGLADARNTMEFVAALYASAFTAKPVRYGEIAPGNPFYTSMEGIGAPWR